jgi:TorA maturation chaperone TorD
MMDTLIGLLEARTIVYSLFQKLTGTEPDEQSLQDFFSPEALAVLKIFDQGVFPAYSDTIKLYESCSEAYHKDKVAFLEQARSEYTRNFIGPDHLIAPPWESAITSVDHLLMQESTLHVRRFYASEGFQADQYPKIADDHLAYELDFLRRLSELCKDAYSVKNETEFKRLLDSQIAFLDEHLLTWIEPYAVLLQKSKTKTLYPQLAFLLHTYLLIDRELLGDLMLKSA